MTNHLSYSQYRGFIYNKPYFKLKNSNDKYCHGFVYTLNYLGGVDNNNFCLFK